jgi:hypothetical protein
LAFIKGEVLADLVALELFLAASAAVQPNHTV